MAVFVVYNGAVPGAAALVKQATGTALRTQLQLATSSTAREIQLKAWSFEFDGTSANTPIECEVLIHTGGPQTTLTTYNAADIAKVDGNAVGGSATTLQLGAALSGFGTGAVEVAPTTVRNIQSHLVPPTAGIFWQEDPAALPFVPTSAFVRTRVTSGTNVNCYNGVWFIE